MTLELAHTQVSDKYRAELTKVALAGRRSSTYRGISTSLEHDLHALNILICSLRQSTKIRTQDEGSSYTLEITVG